MNNQKNSKLSGYGTLEMLIAFSIFSISLGGVATLAFGNQSISVDSQRNNEALQIAQEAVESFRSLAQTNFDGIKNISAYACGTAMDYSCSLSVVDVSSDVKNVTETVSWVIDGRNQNVVLSSTLVNLNQCVAQGGCGPNSAPPATCPSIQTTGSPLNLPSGSFANGLDVIGNTVYLAVRPSASSGDDFYVVDANNFQSPSVLKSLSTGSGSVNAVDTATVGTHIYTYLATAKSNGQFQIADVTVPGSASIISGSTFALPGNAMPATAIVYYKNPNNNHDYVYIATENNSAGPEFFVVDATVPGSPVLVSGGSYEVGSRVNAIYVRGDYAYLAVNSSAAQEIVLNIASGAPVFATQFSDLGAAGGQSLYFSGGKFYLGTSPGPVGGSVLPRGFYVLDNSAAPILTKLGAKTLSYAANGITVSGNYAFVASSLSFVGFQVYNVSSPASIPAACTTASLSGAGAGIVYQNGLVYLAIKSQEGLKILKMQ